VNKVHGNMREHHHKAVNYIIHVISTKGCGLWM